MTTPPHGSVRTSLPPTAMQEKNLNTMLDHVIAWSDALRTLRDKR